MRRTSPTLETSHLRTNDEALLRCQSALELKDKGDYEGAAEVMRPYWNGIGERPQTKDLHPSVAANVLLCAGILTRSIGSRSGLKQAQESAKNLITESITCYESVGDVRKIAEARVELAYCYWWEGELEEARIMFGEALQKLTIEGNTRAWGLLGLAVVEWSASRYSKALDILTDNAQLFKKITSHAIKGAYRNQLAVVLEEIAASEKRDDYFQRAIDQYKEADHHFKLAQNTAFRADIKNNLGYLLSKLSRFREAHRHLQEARRLASSVRNKVAVAQIDETRAQTYLSQNRFKEAAAAARDAVSVLEKTENHCSLADALITRGIALARLQKTEAARFSFQRAIDVAHQVGALNKAGSAALSMSEELDQLPLNDLQSAYDAASEWLSKCQSRDLTVRLNAVARKLISRMRGEEGAEGAAKTLLNKPQNLPQELLEVERKMIRKALASVNGSVTHAASLLGLSYQRLAYIIEARHKVLLKERSPVHRRTRKD